MTSIAVIGCSHSSYRQSPDTWTAVMAAQYPTIEFHDYASGGSGAQYVDMVLKLILDCDYDLVIVQNTSSQRWCISKGSSRLYRENGEFVNIFEKQHSHLPNLWHYTLEVNSHKYNETIPQNCPNKISFWDERSEYFTYPEFYTLITRTTLEKVYSKLFKNLMYFGWPVTYYEYESTDNIGKGMSAMDWLFGKYQKNLEQEYWIAERFFDETLHLNPEANKMFFNEYIMTSKIGEFLENNK
jgi:hypothetical protein